MVGIVIATVTENNVSTKILQCSMYGPSLILMISLCCQTDPEIDQCADLIRFNSL